MPSTANASSPSLIISRAPKRASARSPRITSGCRARSKSYRRIQRRVGKGAGTAFPCGKASRAPCPPAASIRIAPSFGGHGAREAFSYGEAVPTPLPTLQSAAGVGANYCALPAGEGMKVLRQILVGEGDGHELRPPHPTVCVEALSSPLPASGGGKAPQRPPL